MADYVLNEGGQSKISVQGIKENKTAATTVVGSIKELNGGRYVMYCLCSTAAGIARGASVQSSDPVANHVQRPVAVTASVGAKEVILTIGATSASQDQYADGLLLVTCGTNSGDLYKIQGHTAWAASSTAAKVLLKDGLERSLNTASFCHLIRNQGKDVITVPAAGPTNKFLGVALTSAVAGTYFYVGHKGLFAALQGTGTVTQGVAIMPACAASSLENINSADLTKGMVGVAVTSAAANSGAYFIIDLK